jgi:hypothetical protein
MASILDRYGIKEVADVVFYKIEDDGTAGVPVLYLDSLKVSTIEQTAETTYAQGGKGNPRLIGWDFGKEITLSLEDALFSPKSMAIMFGDGTVDKTVNQIKKTIAVNAKLTNEAKWTDANGNEFAIEGGVTYTDEEGKKIEGATLPSKFFATFNIKVSGQKIEVGPNTFPGTYYITGDTYARSEITGDDDYFQFIVPKGKITSENTITMEAEGDPSVFNMTVDVLRATVDGKPTMMQLIKYGIVDSTDEGTDEGGAE